MDRISIRKYKSECGTLVLGACSGMLCLCDWEASEKYRREAGRLARTLDAEIVETEETGKDGAGGDIAVLRQAARELDEYFSGVRKDFDVPVMVAGTEFQRQVREALRGIGYGETATYSEIAARIGRPDAVRGVANAIGGNQVSVFVPCHRVVGKDGGLTGYRGGLDAKRSLLALEKK